MSDNPLEDAREFANRSKISIEEAVNAGIITHLTPYKNEALGEYIFKLRRQAADEENIRFHRCGFAMSNFLCYMCDKLNGE
jgi:DNA-binding PucR family transcriptional regulator